MVSTRTQKYKFSDGERVLCYEPDRKKAKVLYDSKVLEVKPRKDDRGRKVVEYLIHFQGWNSSWDRCVSEDYVLKDTEENRKLQRDLAEKAQLQQGAYLYRKDQKKKKSVSLSERILEATNSISSQEGASNEEQEYLSSSDDDKTTYDSDESLERCIPLQMSSSLRTFLETDSTVINTQNKLVKLPASPNVIQILEGYVRHFSSHVLTRDEDCNTRSRNRTPTVNPQPLDKAQELELICARVNLCKELVDGLRICFDYYLGNQLLYSSEKSQYLEFESGNKVYITEFKQEVLSEDETSKSDDPFISGRVTASHLTDLKDFDRRRSLRSHKEQTTETCVANGVSKLTARNLGNLGAQTSLHCSARSSSSTSSYYGPLAASNTHLASGAGPLTAELAKLNTLTSTWRLVPESYFNERPPPPSTVYGAIHLARLFVKLPSFLFAANMPEKENQQRFLSEQKLKHLLHYLQSFLKYLESKPEWFTHDHYINNPMKSN